MKALDRSVETLGLWIVTFSVTFIKYVNQSSIKPCLIVHLVAMWTLIYFISEWVDRKFYMSVGQAEYAPRSNKVEDQTNSFSYGRKFSYPKYRRRVIFRNKNTIDVPNFTWFKRSWTSLRKTVDLPIKKEMCLGKILTQVINFFTTWWNPTIRLILVIVQSRVQFGLELYA